MNGIKRRVLYQGSIYVESAGNMCNWEYLNPSPPKGENVRNTSDFLDIVNLKVVCTIIVAQ